MLTPPYDVISPVQQQAYHDRHPSNIIRIDYGLDVAGEDKYARAASTLNAWIRKKILVRDKKPGIYVTEHEFLDLEGRRRVRRGFTALLRLEKFSSGIVLPHEQTFRKHKKDRLMQLRATGAHLNPVFAFFPDPDGAARTALDHAIAAAGPDNDFHFEDGATNRLWRVHDKNIIAALQQAVRDRHIYIADGHHRYETSLNFRREIRKRLGSLSDDHPARFTLVYFCAAEDPGLAVTTPHRLLKNLPNFDKNAVLKRLSKFFVVDASERICALDNVHDTPAGPRFSVQIGTTFYCLTRKNSAVADKILSEIHKELRNLPVTVCNHLIVEKFVKDEAKLLKHISYETDPVAVAHRVESGECDMAVYMPPFDMKQLTDAVEARQVFPHKSTYFYPKLVTGLAIHRINVK